MSCVARSLSGVIQSFISTLLSLCFLISLVDGFEGACNGQGPCTKPGTVCFHTELYGIGWADKELCMCRGGLVGDPYTTGCHEPASKLFYFSRTLLQTLL